MNSTFLVRKTNVYSIKLESSPDNVNYDNIRQAAAINEELFPGCEAVKFAESYLWIARDENKKIVGFATTRYLPEEKYGFLSRAAVIPTHRRNGIHKRLLKCRIKHASSQGWNGLITYVCNTNIPSLNSLVKAGFKFYAPAYRWAGKDFMYLMRRFDD